MKNRGESLIPSIKPTPTPYSPKPSRTEAPITPAPKPGSLSIQDFFPSLSSQPNVNSGETPRPPASSSQKYPSQVPQPYPSQQNQDPQSYQSQQYPTQDQNPQPSLNQQYPSQGQVPQAYPIQQSQHPQPSTNQPIPSQSHLSKPSTNQQNQSPKPFPNQKIPSQGQMSQPYPNQQNPPQDQMPQPFPNQQSPSQGQLPQSSTYQQNPSQGQVPQPYPNQYYQPDVPAIPALPLTNNYPRGVYASLSQNQSQEFMNWPWDKNTAEYYGFGGELDFLNGDNSQHLIPNKKPSSGYFLLKGPDCRKLLCDCLCGNLDNPREG